MIEKIRKEIELWNSHNILNEGPDIPISVLMECIKKHLPKEPIKVGDIVTHFSDCNKILAIFKVYGYFNQRLHTPTGSFAIEDCQKATPEEIAVYERRMNDEKNL